MHRSRPTPPRTVALVAASAVLALAVLAGCGHGKRSSITTANARPALAGPAGAASPASAGVGTGSGAAVASTTVPGGDSGTLGGASPAGGDNASSTAATNLEGDTAAPPADPTAPGGAPQTVAGEQAPPTSPVTASAALVRQIFARLYSYTLSDPEAACIDRNIPAADLRAIDAAGDADPGNAQIVEIAQALARCEPAAFVDDQAALLVETNGITGERATCVVRAADQLAASDANIAAVLLDDWAQLAAGPSRDQLVASVATCVDHDTAVAIVTG